MLALDQRPVLLSAAQVVDRLDDGWRALDPTQIVAEAVEKAIAGSGKAEGLRKIIDHVTLTRTFVDSVPEKIRYHFAPFGYSDGLPISVAEHLGLSGVTLQYAQAGGQSPQEHVAKLAEAVARGECRAAVLCGGEAIGTMRRHQRSGTNVDWSEKTSGDFIDDGIGLDGMFMPYLARHKALAPTDIYPLFEHAKRHQLGEDRVAYRLRLGRLLARLAEVAQANPNSMFTMSASADEIGTESAGNRVIADPHLKSMVAKDGVNQAAAVIITSYQQARELGLAERAVFLNGYGIATETDVLNRPDLGNSPALHWAYAQALSAAEVSVDDIDAFDLYSCFPVAVIEALAALGLDAGDSRPLTLTGGLPFFGGPGNSYSLHAIASAVESIQTKEHQTVMVGALGGNLSKHAVGIYSSEPNDFDVTGEQPTFVPGDELVQVDESYSGVVRVETFTVKSVPEGTWIIAIGRTLEDNRRVVSARVANEDDVSALFLNGEPIGARIVVQPLEDESHHIVGLA